MAEVMTEVSYVRHHPKKIAFLFSAMRSFAAELEKAGWRVAYTRLNDPENGQCLSSELLRRSESSGASVIRVTQPGEWRVISELEALPLKLEMLPDTRFICSLDRFNKWADGRKELRMEYFYREMRRETGLLMEGKDPVGRKWNYDKDNRKPAAPDLFRAPPLRHDPDPITEEVLDLVADRFGDNFGDLRPFGFATTREGAEAARDDFLAARLPQFGDEQDAMLCDDRFLSHSLLSIYLNAGLLDPLDLCRRAEAEYHAGRAPLNAVEGFIRQILGWREFVRGIYFREGPDYTRRNGLHHRRDLPSFYWGAETKMLCIAKAVEQTQAEAYAHHIQRLMVTGNFALLAGIDPHQLHEWYLEVYADAYEWVEAPNTIGMSQFADGGVVGSKPYVSSGAYINRMSDYCRSCAYKVSKKTGEGACPFNLLYWHFLARHADKFAKNPRMAQIYRNWDRMEDERKDAVLSQAEEILARLDTGELV